MLVYKAMTIKEEQGEKMKRSTSRMPGKLSILINVCDCDNKVEIHPNS